VSVDPEIVAVLTALGGATLIALPRFERSLTRRRGGRRQLATLGGYAAAISVAIGVTMTERTAFFYGTRHWTSWTVRSHVIQAHS
jgi:hypothetical protein